MPGGCSTLGARIEAGGLRGVLNVTVRACAFAPKLPAIKLSLRSAESQIGFFGGEIRARRDGMVPPRHGKLGHHRIGGKKEKKKKKRGINIKVLSRHNGATAMKERNKERTEHLRSDFVGGVSAYHVQNGKLTARMLAQPRVQPKDIIFEYDNAVAIGNHAVHRLRRQNGITRHVGGGRAGLLGRCTRGLYWRRE